MTIGCSEGSNASHTRLIRSGLALQRCSLKRYCHVLTLRGIEKGPCLPKSAASRKGQNNRLAVGPAFKGQPRFGPCGLDPHGGPVTAIGQASAQNTLRPEPDVLKSKFAKASNRSYGSEGPSLLCNKQCNVVPRRYNLCRANAQSLRTRLVSAGASSNIHHQKTCLQRQLNNAIRLAVRKCAKSGAGGGFTLIRQPITY